MIKRADTRLSIIILLEGSSNYTFRNMHYYWVYFRNMYYIKNYTI